MKYSELRRLCDECLCGIAGDIVDNILSGMDEDEEINEWDMDDRISEEIDSYMTYYSDAWDYLQDNGITDFSDAIANGCEDVTSIACYYALEEVRDEVNNYWYDYEDTEEEPEEEDSEESEEEDE